MCRHAHPKATQTLLITRQTEASRNPSQHSPTNTLDFADVDVSDSKMFPRVARSRDGLVQAVFRVCVGVRSGPKGPVIDFSICGVAPDTFAND